jgi:hypothetical protein
MFQRQADLLEQLREFMAPPAVDILKQLLCTPHNLTHKGHVRFEGETKLGGDGTPSDDRAITLPENFDMMAHGRVLGAVKWAVAEYDPELRLNDRTTEYEWWVQVKRSPVYTGEFAGGELLDVVIRPPGGATPTTVAGDMVLYAYDDQGVAVCLNCCSCGAVPSFSASPSPSESASYRTTCRDLNGIYCLPLTDEADTYWEWTGEIPNPLAHWDWPPMAPTLTLTVEWQHGGDPQTGSGPLYIELENPWPYAGPMTWVPVENTTLSDLIDGINGIPIFNPGSTSGACITTGVTADVVCGCDVSASASESASASVSESASESPSYSGSASVSPSPCPGFTGTEEWVKDLERDGDYLDFTKVTATFEDGILCDTTEEHPRVLPTQARRQNHRLGVRRNQHPTQGQRRNQHRNQHRRVPKNHRRHPRHRQQVNQLPSQHRRAYQPVHQNRHPRVPATVAVRRSLHPRVRAHEPPPS